MYEPDHLVTAIVVGSLAVAATAFAAQPMSGGPRPARSKPAATRVYSRAPRRGSLSVSHVTRRSMSGAKRALANQLARAAGDARVSCLEEGQRPETQGYRACVTTRRSRLASGC